MAPHDDPVPEAGSGRPEETPNTDEREPQRRTLPDALDPTSTRRRREGPILNALMAVVGDNVQGQLGRGIEELPELFAAFSLRALEDRAAAAGPNTNADSGGGCPAGDGNTSNSTR
eukprot:TRINITY_DN44135_c0_g1_i1.p2 TRINITY_DN44135_c0_g1~~TRINITY_DN44135_c0_g1_i1.p2  ORF type:complete len:116 (+),score=11.65 TRINITY_DN44135_c0_g1_i1:179-526(+)